MPFLAALTRRQKEKIALSLRQESFEGTIRFHFRQYSRGRKSLAQITWISSIHNQYLPNFDTPPPTITNQNYNCKDGDYLIRQGEVGRKFYLLEEGEVLVTMRNDFQDLAEEERELAYRSAIDYFGEFALLSEQKRSANVKAIGFVKCATLTGDEFDKLLISHTSAHDAMLAREVCTRGNVLDSIRLLSHLTSLQKTKIIEQMRMISFEDGEYICRQGERGDTFFIITSGEAVVQRRKGDIRAHNEELASPLPALKRRMTQRKLKLLDTLEGDTEENHGPGHVIINGDNEIEIDVDILAYKYKGEVFGELSLLNDCKRNADVIAVGKVQCLYLHRSLFQKKLPHLADLLKHNAELSYVGVKDDHAKRIGNLVYDDFTRRSDRIVPLGKGVTRADRHKRHAKGHRDLDTPEAAQHLHTHHAASAHKHSGSLYVI